MRYQLLRGTLCVSLLFRAYLFLRKVSRAYGSANAGAMIYRKEKVGPVLLGASPDGPRPADRANGCCGFWCDRAQHVYSHFEVGEQAYWLVWCVCVCVCLFLLDTLFKEVLS